MLCKLPSICGTFLLGPDLLFGMCVPSVGVPVGRSCLFPKTPKPMCYSPLGLSRSHPVPALGMKGAPEAHKQELGESTECSNYWDIATQGKLGVVLHAPTVVKKNKNKKH